MLLTCARSASAQATLRYSTTTNGAVTFTGNSLGLDGATDDNGQGTRGAVGTFITTDATQRDTTPPPASAPPFPFGTTNDWRLNSSSALLRLPAGAQVLRAELIWGGTFAGNTPADNVSAFIDNAVSFTTPAGAFSVAPDPATARTFGSVLANGTCSACAYARTADVTALVVAGGAGTYRTGGVAATQGTTDNSAPAAGWTLAVVFEDVTQPIRYLSLMLGLEQSGGAVASMSGFCTPSKGQLSGRLAISAMEGDAWISGDEVRFADHTPLNNGDRLDGPRNPRTNFFSGQIAADDGGLDTSGTFGTLNHTPDAPVAGARQGWDITNVDVSKALGHTATTVFLQAIGSADTYYLTALALQIDVEAPRFASGGSLSVDRATAVVGDVLTYTVSLDNSTGSADAANLVFFDTLPPGISFVAGSFTVDGAPQAGADIASGVPLGTIAAGTTATIQFQARVDAALPTHQRVNQARWTFDYANCSGSPAQGTGFTNTVTTVVPVADLTITKSQITSPAIPGSLVSYRIVVRNNGPSAAPGTIVTDSGATPSLVNMTWTCVGGPLGSTCPASGTGGINTAVNLVPGGTVTFTLRGTLPADIAAGTILNGAAVTAPTGVPDLDTSNNTASVSGPIQTSADVGVVATGPGSAQRGTNVTYNIMVRNNGPSIARGVVVTTPVPAGLTLVSPLSGPCAAAPGCDLAPGGTETLSVTFEIPPDYAGPETIVASATAAAATADPQPLNNSDDAQTILNAPLVDLTLTKTNGVTEVTAGLTTTYTITITNPSPAAAPATRLVDRFDPAVFDVAGVRWQCAASGGSGCPAASGTGDIDTLIDVFPGAGNEVVITAVAPVLSTVPGSADTPSSVVTNVATVTPAAGIGESRKGDNRDTDTDTVRTVADLSITRTGPATIVPGTSVDYVITVSSAGPSSTRNVVFFDLLEQGGASFSGPLLRDVNETVQAPPDSHCDFESIQNPGTGEFGVMPVCTIPELEPGGTRTFTIRLEFPADLVVKTGVTQITGTAAFESAVLDEDPDAGDHVRAVISSVEVMADVAVKKTAAAAVVAGNALRYFVEVSNHGPSAVTHVVAEDALPAGLIPVASSGPCAAAFIAATPCPIGTVAPGQRVTTSIDLLVPPDYSGSPTITNTAAALSQDLGTGGDTDPTNNQQTVLTRVAPTHADVGVTLSGPASVPSGGTINYIGHVTNFGPGPAFNVTSSDVLPAGATLIGGSVPAGGSSCTTPTSGVSNLVSCLTPVLQVGETLEFRFTLLVDPRVVAGSVITNLAVASSATPGHNPNNNQALLITRVTDADESELSIEATDAPDPVVAGGTVTYTLTVRNVGPAAATGVSVTDTLPPEFTLVSATPSQGACAGATCSLGTMPAGSTGTVTVVATASAAGVFANTATVTATEPDPVLTNNAVNQPTTVANGHEADLAIEKIGPTLVAPGNTTFYVLIVTNRGPASASNVQVFDVLPAGLTFLGNSGACDTPFPCRFDALAPGQSVQIFTAITVDPAAATPANVLNAATVTSSITADPNPLNNQAAVTTLIDAADNADVVLTKVDSPDPVLSGTTLSYAVSVVNRGPGPAIDVVLSDILPAGLTLISATPTVGTCAGTTIVTCTIGTMSPGAAAEVGLLASITAGADLTNTASAQSPSPDPNPGTRSMTQETTVLPPFADLTVATVLATPAIPGLTGTSQVVVRNAGPRAMTGALVVDAFPAALTGVTWTCVADALSACAAPSGAGSLSTTVDLQEGGSVTFVATGTIASSATGLLINTATIAPPGNATDPNPANNVAASSMPLTTSADLRVSQSGPAQATPGGSVTYTFMVTNAGPSDAVSVTLSAPTPPGLAFVAGGGACASYPCALGTLTAAATTTATATFAVPPGYSTPDPIVSTATVSSATTPDPATDNNTATAASAIAAPVTDLGITKSNGVATVVPGTSITYTIAVTNAGPSDATGATVTDVFAPALTGVTWTCATPSGGSCAAPAGSGNIATTVNLPAGATAFFTATASIAPDAVGVLVNTASVAPAPGASDPSSANNTDQDVLTPRADVAISKAGPSSVAVGAPIAYTIRVTNNGPSNAENVVVTDPAPTGLRFESNSGECTTPFPCNLGALAAGATRTITATFNLPSAIGVPLPITNTATVTSTTEDTVPSNNVATVETDLDVDADIDVGSSVMPAIVRAGDAVTITVTARNNGPSPSTGVEITDVLPAGLQLVAAAPDAGVYDPATGRWALRALAVGERARLVVNATALASGSITNLAVKTGQNEPDPVAANDSAAATTNPPPSADVALAHTSDRPDAAAGETVTFSVIATNRGPDAVTGVTISDLLPPGLTFVSAASSRGVYVVASGTWTIDTIPPSAEETLTIAAMVNQPGAIANNAAVISQDQIDPNPLNNDAAAAINAAGTADLRVAKGVSNPTPAVGTTVTYTITVSNLGPEIAAAAAIADPLPPGLAFVSATASQGSYDRSTGIWTAGAIVPGATEALSIVGRVNRPGVSENTATRQLTASIDPNAANDEASVTISPVVVGDLAVTVEPTSPVAVPGGSVAWIILATNQGPSPVTGARLAAAVTPAVANLQWTCTPAGGAACGTPSGAGVIDVMVHLTVNGTVTLAVTGVLPDDLSGNVVTVAAVTAPAGASDANPTNNTASGSVQVAAIADLAIVKTGPAIIPAGATAVYIMTITNAGPGQADGVILDDPAPAGATFVSASSPCTSGFPCALGVIAPGATVTVTASFRSVPPFDASGAILNTATVRAATTDPVPGNNTAAARTAIRRAGCDLTGDGVDEMVTGAGPGGGPHVQVLGVTGSAPIGIASFYAYDPLFGGGVFVACGDVDGDGRADIVTGADAGGGPHVRVFRLAGGSPVEIAGFYAYDPAFTGGVRVATADLDGDGVNEIITGAGRGGGPHVRAFRLAGPTPLQVASFYAYDPAYAGGVFVAGGDVMGDGKASIVTATSQTAGPVRVFSIDAAGVVERMRFFAYFSRFLGEVRLATGDVDGDGIAEIITGTGPGGGPHVMVWSVAAGSPTALASFFAYAPEWCDVQTTDPAPLVCDGTYVGVSDVDGDGRAEVITATNRSGGPVRIFKIGPGVTELTSFDPYFEQFKGPVRVAGAMQQPAAERPRPQAVRADSSATLSTRLHQSRAPIETRRINRVQPRARAPPLSRRAPPRESARYAVCSDGAGPAGDRMFSGNRGWLITTSCPRSATCRGRMARRESTSRDRGSVEHTERTVHADAGFAEDHRCSPGWGEAAFGTTVYLNPAKQYHAATLNPKRRTAKRRWAAALNLEGGGRGNFLKAWARRRSRLLCVIQADARPARRIFPPR